MFPWKRNCDKSYHLRHTWVTAPEAIMWSTLRVFGFEHDACQSQEFIWPLPRVDERGTVSVQVLSFARWVSQQELFREQHRSLLKHDARNLCQHSRENTFVVTCCWRHSSNWQFAWLRLSFWTFWFVFFFCRHWLLQCPSLATCDPCSWIRSYSRAVFLPLWQMHDSFQRYHLPFSVSGSALNIEMSERVPSIGRCFLPLK